MKRILTIQLLLLLCIKPMASQSGGAFAISQAVMASGGGTSAGNQFSVTGTIGQSIAGRASSSPPYSVTGGFWQAFVAPTAGGVTISGRVVTQFGRPIFRARLTVIDRNGNVRQATSSSFGYFRFEGLPAGEDYALSTSHRLYRFDTILVSARQDVADVRIVGTRP